MQALIECCLNAWSPRQTVLHFILDLTAGWIFKKRKWLVNHNVAIDGVVKFRKYIRRLDLPNNFMRRFFSFLLLMFAASLVAAADIACSIHLRIDYQEGGKGCLTDLNFSKKIVKGWGRPLHEIIKSNPGHAVVASDICPDIYVSTFMSLNPSETAKEMRIHGSKGLCDEACDCKLVVLDGRATIKKEALIALGTTENTFQNTQKKLTPTLPIVSVAAPNKSDEQDREKKLERLNQQALESASQKKALEDQNKELEARAEILKAQLRNEEGLRQRENALQAQELRLRETQKLMEEVRLKEEQLRFQQQNTVKETVAVDSAKGTDRELILSLAAELAKLKATTEKANLAKAEQVSLTKETSVAQIPNVYANRKALIIGNDSYKFVQPLLNAREDAKAMSDGLKKAGYQITLLLDQDERSFKAAIRTFRSRIEPGDEVALFFAGHGVQLGNVNYLIPLDVAGESEEQLRDEAIPLQRLLDDMSEKKAKFTLAMIDACRDNPFKSNWRALGGGPRGLAPTTAATGQMIVFSAGTGQQALDRLDANDKNKNGVFTRVFIKEMLKPNLTVDRLIRKVRNEVVELAKSVGHDQVPAIYDQTIGEFYLLKQ